MQVTDLKAGDRVQYVSQLGENSTTDSYGEAVVDRIDTYDNGLVWLLIGEKGYERSKPFNPSWIIKVIKPTQIAQTILIQLGGHKFVAITGSKDFLALDNGLRFKLARNRSSANRCQITLRPDDTYDVIFSRQTLNKKTLDVTIKSLAQYEGVYFDQLQDLFTSVTGLYTSLGTMAQ